MRERKTYCTAGSCRAPRLMLISLPPRTEALGFAPRAVEFNFLLPFEPLFKLFFWMAMTISLPMDSICSLSTQQKLACRLPKLERSFNFSGPDESNDLSPRASRPWCGTPAEEFWLWG